MIKLKIKENLNATSITEEDVRDRKTFRHKVFYWNLDLRVGLKRKKDGTVWSS